MDNKCNNGKTGSCRKGKRSVSDKPKQPQRGLGVAQLEKIRMQNEIMANYVPTYQTPYQSGFEVGYVDASRTDTWYGGSHQSAAIRSSVHGEPVSFAHNGAIGQPDVALPLFAQSLEDSIQWKRNCNYQAPSMCHHYYNDSMDTQEVDLELRLAL